MGHPRFTEDFKIDAVKQITKRGLFRWWCFAAVGRQHAFTLCVGKEVFSVSGALLTL